MRSAAAQPGTPTTGDRSRTADRATRSSPCPVVGGDHWRAGRSSLPVHEDNRLEFCEQGAEIRLGHARRAQYDAVAPPSRLEGEDPLLSD